MRYIRRNTLRYCALRGLGVGGAWLVSDLADMVVEITLSAIALSFLFAAAIGIFFGFYPARRAARLKPVEALRYE